jgi:hypothetical protein
VIIGKSLQTLRAEGRKPQNVQRKIAKINFHHNGQGLLQGWHWYFAHSRC